MKVEGERGSWQVPRARVGVGGVEERRLRVWGCEGVVGEGWMYWREGISFGYVEVVKRKKRGLGIVNEQLGIRITN